MTAHTFLYWVYPALCVAMALVILGCNWVYPALCVAMALVILGCMGLLVRAYKKRP
jgi:hypothetical protein